MNALPLRHAALLDFVIWVQSFLRCCQKSGKVVRGKTSKYCRLSYFGKWPKLTWENLLLFGLFGETYTGHFTVARNYEESGLIPLEYRLPVGQTQKSLKFWTNRKRLFVRSPDYPWHIAGTVESPIDWLEWCLCGKIPLLALWKSRSLKTFILLLYRRCAPFEKKKL